MTATLWLHMARFSIKMIQNVLSKHFNPYAHWKKCILSCWFQLALYPATGLSHVWLSASGAQVPETYHSTGQARRKDPWKSTALTKLIDWIVMDRPSFFFVVLPVSPGCQVIWYTLSSGATFITFCTSDWTTNRMTGDTQDSNLLLWRWIYHR